MPTQRKLLIELVQKGNKTIKDAATQLQINYSTAKHIIKTSLKSKKSRQYNLSEKSETSSEPSDDSSFCESRKTKKKKPIQPGTKRSPPIDVQKLQEKVKGLHETNATKSLYKAAEVQSATINEEQSSKYTAFDSHMSEAHPVA